MLTKDDLLAIGRMCRIITGNNFGDEELDALALWIGHHPDVLNPPNTASSPTVPSSPAGGEPSDSRHGGLCPGS